MKITHSCLGNPCGRKDVCQANPYFLFLTSRRSFPDVRLPLEISFELQASLQSVEADRAELHQHLDGCTLIELQHEFARLPVSDQRTLIIKALTQTSPETVKSMLKGWREE